MTRREDNSLLDAADAHHDALRGAAKAIDAAVALVAFGVLCLGLWLALHLGVVVA